MSIKADFNSYAGLTRKEWGRILRLWPQTLIPPIVTSLLYFLIFGRVIGSRLGQVDGVSYMAFIVPGLVMMSIIMNAYMNVAFSFYLSRFTHAIDDLLISPMKNSLIIFGYMSGGLIRGGITSTAVLLMGLFFSHVHIAHLFFLTCFMLLTGLLFSLAGFLNGVFAKSFDDTMIMTTFILTPLIYLGGVFYNIKSLTGVWYYLSLINPIYYIVTLMRYAILGSAHVSIWPAFLALVSLIFILFFICLFVLKKGIRLKE